MKLTRILMVFTFLFLTVSVTDAQTKDQTDTTKVKHTILNNKDKSCCSDEGSKECTCGEKEHHQTSSTKNEDVKTWNKVCPVSGEEIDNEAPTFEYNGKLIGFCCPGCDKKFRKDPERYIKNLSEDGSRFMKI